MPPKRSQIVKPTLNNQQTLEQLSKTMGLHFGVMPVNSPEVALMNDGGIVPPDRKPKKKTYYFQDRN